MRKSIQNAVAVLLCFCLLFSVCVPCFAADSALPFPDSQYYEQGDYRIHYRVIAEEGERKGNILFLHGFLYSGESFAPMAAEMSRNGYRCVLVDLPGFGYSTRESADVTPIDREELVMGLMQSIAPADEWILAGHSMGGGVALNIACEYPQIQSLLLFAPAPIQPVSDSMRNLVTSDFAFSAFRFLLQTALKMQWLVRVMMLMATMDREYTQNYDLSVLTAPLQEEGTADSMLYMMTRARPTDTEAMKMLSMPVLLVRGDRDMVVSASMCEAMDSALLAAGAQQYTVAGGGHMIQETHCGEVSSLALAFLQK